jgi:8-oxo-dGTP pyrophosphatase MutT (NUDIX family)
MLVTSRGTRRWIIPKGWPKIGLPLYKTAEEEAFEEAGLSGRVSKRQMGSYSYEKMLKDGRTTKCRVQVYALRVTRQHRQRASTGSGRRNVSGRSAGTSRQKPPSL